MPEDAQQDVVQLGDEDVQGGTGSAHEVVLSAASLRIEALEAQGKAEAAASGIPTSSWWAVATATMVPARREVFTCAGQQDVPDADAEPEEVLAWALRHRRAHRGLQSLRPAEAPAAYGGPGDGPTRRCRDAAGVEGGVPAMAPYAAAATPAAATAWTRRCRGSGSPAKRSSRPKVRCARAAVAAALTLPARCKMPKSLKKT